jgi:crotonobetainyl-CoA:carnitine CoA-transferase CaiB-like acyl-CoA transferase
MSVTGEPGGRPVKSGIPIADFASGLYAAFSVVCGLQQARRDSAVGHIDVSMLGAMLGIAHLQTSELFGTGKDPVPLGSAHPMNAPYAAFRCRDGYVALAAGTDKLWEAACAGIERPHIARDARFASPTLRARNQNELREVLEAEFARYDRAQLLAIFGEKGVPCAPINSYSQVLADPQVQHLGLVAELELPNGAPTRMVISPQKIGGESLGIYRRPPALGEHSAEVLAELKAEK